MDLPKLRAVSYIRGWPAWENRPMKKPHKTPECDKLSSLIKERNAIAQFLEWLQEQGIELAAYHKHTDSCYDEEGDRCCVMSENLLYSLNKRNETMAHEFLEIDEKKLEDERQAILESLQP